MDEVPLSSTTIIELGLNVSDPIEEDQIIPENRVKANLPAIPETVPGVNRMQADLVDLAALTDPDPDREAARDRKRARLVRNENKRSIHFATIEFEPEVQANGDIHAVAWYSHIPNEPKVKKVVPYYYTGPEFLKPIGSGKYISGGTFQCVLFSPETKNGPYKALPLGMADPKTLRTLNEIATRRNALPAFKNDQWPIINIIEHELRRPGVRRVRFIPRFDLHADLQSGCKKRQLLGSHYGQKVYLAPKATVPEPDEKDGVKGFFEKHLFRVKKLKENYIEVVWLGKVGDVLIEDRISIEDVQNEMNPFVVLNTTPMLVDWKTIDQTTRKWVNGNRPYDQKNPLYLAAIDLGLVHATDDAILKRAHLEQLWKEAVRLVRLEMIEAAKLAHKKLTIAPKKPSVAEIMGDETRIETLLLYLNEPEDAAANWIGQAFDKPFDPKSPFLMHLRAWLINTVVKTKPQTMVSAPTSEPSQPSIRIPELTPAPQGLEHSDVPPPIPSRRELSNPSFRASGTFKAVPTSPELPDEIHLHADDLEEMEEDVVAEATTVDFRPEDQELSFFDRDDLEQQPYKFSTGRHVPMDPTGVNGALPPEDTPTKFWRPRGVLATGRPEDK